MIYKIWPKFFLLTVLSLIPVLSHAQQCITSAGFTSNGTVTTTSTPSGTVVSVPFKFVIQKTPCFVMATPLSPVGTSTNEALTVTKNGVTVDFNESVLGIPSGGCTSSPQATVINFLSCSSLPRENTVVIRYTLKGKSTTIDPNIKFFDAKLTGFPTLGSTTGAVTAAGIQVNVPASTGPTCLLSVPSNVAVPTTALKDFVLTGARGAATEATGTSFNIRISCDPNGISVTPTVTFSYGEGVACMPGNGATAPAAQNIGFAIKTNATSSSISDYICGRTGSGSVNVVSFPATTANVNYDQSKTFFVNYVIQGSPQSNGFVKTNITLTTTFP